MIHKVHMKHRLKTKSNIIFQTFHVWEVLSSMLFLLDMYTVENFIKNGNYIVFPWKRFLFPFNCDKFQVCTCSTFILFKASFQIIIQWSSSKSDQPQPLPKANWFKLWPPKMTFLLLPNVEKLLLVQNSDLYAVKKPPRCHVSKHKRWGKTIYS